MADDRVYLVCKQCGGMATLYKHYTAAIGHGEGRRELLKWIDYHMTHHPFFDSPSLAGEPGFTLITESAPNFKPDDTTG